LAGKNKLEICAFVFCGHERFDFGKAVVACHDVVDFPKIIHVIRGYVDFALCAQGAVYGIKKETAKKAPALVTPLGPGIGEKQVIYRDAVIRQKIGDGKRYLRA
jgi:hypothetical protein